MINKILMGIIKLIIGLVSVIISPIDNLISQFLPGVDNALTMIGNLLSLITDIIPWVMSWMGVNTTVRTMVISYFVFMLTVPIIVHTIKLAIKWYDKLKP